MVITAETRVAEALEAHPELREVLLGLSPKYKRLENPVLFNTIARFARMKDVARIGGFSVCELLHTLNAAIGTLDELESMFPNCIASAAGENPPEELSRAEEAAQLAEPDFPRLDPPDTPLPEWWEKRGDFEVVDVRGMSEDPFDLLMGRARSLNPGEGFALLQSFRPDPLLDMLGGMGFETVVEQLGVFRYRVWAYKARGPVVRGPEGRDERVPVVLQSATPVVWPVLMRMLQSERLLSRVRFVEAKVWDKTEKHLGWMVRGRADVSFSAIVASTRLFAGGLDIHLASIDVWDNFHLLSRGEPVRELADLRGRTLHLPLIRTAPPYAITSYLLKASGLDPADFSFAFGKPFGRPEQLQAAFARGEIDTVLLREPEASFALFGAGPAANPPLSYDALWSRLHPGSYGLPNAGLVFKGEFVRAHPEEARLIEEEVGLAIDWVREHPDEAAHLAWDVMGHPEEEVRLFLSRVRLSHRRGEEVRDELRNYLQVLVDEGGMKLPGTVEDAVRFLDPVA